MVTIFTDHETGVLKCWPVTLILLPSIFARKVLVGCLGCLGLPVECGGRVQSLHAEYIVLRAEVCSLAVFKEVCCYATKAVTPQLRHTARPL